MAKKLSRLATASTLLLVLVAGFAVYVVLHNSTATAVEAAPARQVVNEIAGYRNWTKVNPTPELMEMRTMMLCARVTTSKGVDVNGAENPHQKKYITVYVNDVGRKAMMEQAKPAFPIGSIIVKEKLPDKTSQSPELLTVMIKKEKGFNPQSGDWEYLVVDGSGQSVQERGKLETCQSCHLSTPQTDYIFRSYLPYAVRDKLK